MTNKIFRDLKNKAQAQRAEHEEMSLEEYVRRVKKEPELYASPAARLLKAIGEPKLIDTAKDERLSRIHRNEILKRYETFSDFYGMEDVIERVVSFVKYAAQGLEESKQILYLKGPVGSAKSSLAERLKELMGHEAIYALKGSPIQESPLGLFDKKDAEALGVPERFLRHRASPWALKRLEEYGGDISKFTVVKLFPNEATQVAISKTEPGDENNQDISTLVGKVDIRKLENLSQDDPDAYSYSGGLCKSNQGILEFVEMFKAPIKMLHPLLTATQEGNYKGTEAIPAIPFDGLILAHSNESEWNTFVSNRNNEAFLDRVSIVNVPYCLCIDEEKEIYEKLLRDSSLKEAPRAPGTLDLLARFAILSRLAFPENSTIESKMKVYNGENIKDKDPNARSLQEYKDEAPREEGFNGMSTRQSFKILSKVYNFDMEEIAADPVHMLKVLGDFVIESDISEDDQVAFKDVLEGYLLPRYCRKVAKDIQTSYLDSYSEFGQSLFDRYLLFADHWIQDKDHRDVDTGQMYNKDALNEELSKIEKPAGIAGVKDFRNEIVQFSLRYASQHNGDNPSWTSYEKIREVIEANMFSKTADLLPVISFTGHGDKQGKSKHIDFVKRMQKLGYTAIQTKRVVEFYMRYTKST